jgi:hypothetical protein
MPNTPKPSDGSQAGSTVLGSRTSPTETTGRAQVRRHRVLLIGNFAAVGALERSYERAFASLGWEVAQFDIVGALSSHSRFGRFGRRIAAAVPVEPWVRQANRDLVLAAHRHMPDVVVAFGGAPVTAGGLAQLYASTGARLALVWQDTLVNLSGPMTASLPLYHWIGCYSQQAVVTFQRLGGRRVEWLPLAADLDLHGSASLPESELRNYACDVSFIGNLRPERERAIEALCASGNLRIRIWGTDDWRKARSHAIRTAFQGRILWGREFAKACHASKVCLNIIDATNYPAANMRFFEIPATGSVEVCSPCPEFAQEFVDGEHLFFYKHTSDLPRLVGRILEDDALRTRVAQAARQLVQGKHTYTHRARQLLAALEDETDLVPSGGVPLDRK